MRTLEAGGQCNVGLSQWVPGNLKAWALGGVRVKPSRSLGPKLCSLWSGRCQVKNSGGSEAVSRRQPAHKTMGWNKKCGHTAGLSFPHTFFIVGDAEYGHRQTLTTWCSTWSSVLHAPQKEERTDPIPLGRTADSLQLTVPPPTALPPRPRGTFHTPWGQRPR